MMRSSGSVIRLVHQQVKTIFPSRVVWCTESGGAMARGVALCPPGSCVVGRRLASKIASTGVGLISGLLDVSCVGV